MSKTILINAAQATSPLGETRVAIIEDGVLTGYDVDPSWREKIRGNIYRGVVTNVEPSLQAAFVDFGGKRHGFMPLADSVEPNLKRRQLVNVQVLKEEIGNKGAALTGYMSLPGRYLVLMPNSDGAHVSRKIEDEEERKRVRKIVESLNPPENMGVIVRTAGMEQPKAVLARDLKYLLKLWAQIQARLDAANGPRLVQRENDAIIRTLRDYLTPDVTRIVTDTAEAFSVAKEFLTLVMPKHVAMLELHDGRRPLFTEHGVEQQTEALFTRKVPLPSGGSLVIDQTEALVAIDVNSGKSTRESSQEETAYRTNLEAVVEVAKQLRLRDLGGIVVVDLIDMMNAGYRAEVEKRFRDAVKDDKARFRISPISQHGLLELTRQRIRPALDATMRACPHCDGRGRVRELGTEGSHLLRAIADRVAVDVPRGHYAKLRVECPTEVALSLLNERRGELLALEAKLDVGITITPRDNLGGSGFALVLDKTAQRPETPAPAPEPKAAAKTVAAKAGKGRGKAAPVEDEDEVEDEPDEALADASTDDWDDDEDDTPVRPAALPPTVAVLPVGVDSADDSAGSGEDMERDPGSEGGKRKRRRRGRRGRGSQSGAPTNTGIHSDEDAQLVAHVPSAALPTPTPRASTPRASTPRASTPRASTQPSSQPQSGQRQGQTRSQRSASPAAAAQPAQRVPLAALLGAGAAEANRSEKYGLGDAGDDYGGDDAGDDAGAETGLDPRQDPADPQAVSASPKRRRRRKRGGRGRGNAAAPSAGA